jgi:hypothetical protein
MKKFLTINHNDSYTVIKQTINNVVETITIGWNALNVPKLDDIGFKLNHVIESQEDTIKYLQNRLMEETNKLNSLKTIKQNLKEQNRLLRKEKGIEIKINSTGETTFITSDVLNTLDKEDYTVLTIGSIPVTKNNKSSQLAQYHEVNEEIFM